ncbi:MAG: peptidoglycan DD-metalloendopeptidase family protein [Fibrobacter sp.]|nr:peptidoglycan DD-metalloendopeptidase family protein [Fibrobacter sp.]
MIYLLFSGFFSIFLCANNKVQWDSFPQFLSIETSEVIPAFIALIENKETYFNQKKAFLQKLKHATEETASLCSLEIVFALRDTGFISRKLIPLLQNDTVHPYFKIRTINTLMQCKYPAPQSLLFSLLTDNNDLVREYAADAIGKLYTNCCIDSFRKIFEQEPNKYVQFTISSSINRLTSNRIAPENHRILDTTLGLLSEPVFNAVWGNDTCDTLIRKNYYHVSSEQIPVSHHFAYPHQQYKLMNDYRRYRRISFGMEESKGYFHVGEDSGWDLDGLPIHSIADGIVVLNLYEPTWGNLVAIESKLPNGKIINHFYGHLSSDVDVKAGDIVKCGQKIGNTGTFLSRDNGGYRSHLHLGIAKGTYEETGVIGYYTSLIPWYNPVTFLYHTTGF